MGGRQCGIFPLRTYARIEALEIELSGSGGVFRWFFSPHARSFWFWRRAGEKWTAGVVLRGFSGVQYILAFSRPGSAGAGPPGLSGCTGALDAHLDAVILLLLWGFRR